jgi:hypothetical protein
LRSPTAVQTYSLDAHQGCLRDRKSMLMTTLCRELDDIVQVSLPLIANRHCCDLLFADAERAEALADWSLCSSIVARFADALRRRICGEECVLFPALVRTVSGMSLPVRRMHCEHVRLAMLLGRLESALGDKNGEAFLASCEDFLALLRHHIAREEEVLYAVAEQAWIARRTAITARVVEPS